MTKIVRVDRVSDGWDVYTDARPEPFHFENENQWDIVVPPIATAALAAEAQHRLEEARREARSRLKERIEQRRATRITLGSWAVALSGPSLTSIARMAADTLSGTAAFPYSVTMADDTPILLSKAQAITLAAAFLQRLAKLHEVEFTATSAIDAAQSVEEINNIASTINLG